MFDENTLHEKSNLIQEEVIIMVHGGKREGSGRKRKGITRKVSLTLSAELWNEIDNFNGTVADYIRDLKVSTPNTKVDNSKNLKKVTKIKKDEIGKNKTKLKQRNLFDLQR